jgi:hypothetical protein
MYSDVNRCLPEKRNIELLGSQLAPYNVHIYCKEIEIVLNLRL